MLQQWLTIKARRVRWLVVQPQTFASTCQNTRTWQQIFAWAVTTRGGKGDILIYSATTLQLSSNQNCLKKSEGTSNLKKNPSDLSLFSLRSDRSRTSRSFSTFSSFVTFFLLFCNFDGGISPSARCHVPIQTVVCLRSVRGSHPAVRGFSHSISHLPGFTISIDTNYFIDVLPFRTLCHVVICCVESLRSHVLCLRPSKRSYVSPCPSSFFFPSIHQRQTSHVDLNPLGTGHFDVFVIPPPTPAEPSRWSAEMPGRPPWAFLSIAKPS